MPDVAQEPMNGFQAVRRDRPLHFREPAEFEDARKDGSLLGDEIELGRVDIPKYPAVLLRDLAHVRSLADAPACVSHDAPSRKREDRDVVLLDGRAPPREARRRGLRSVVVQEGVPC